MDIKIVEEIGRLEKIVEEKYEVFVRDKELISIKIHELQKDIEQGRSKISRTDLYKHQDVLKKEIKDLTRNFMDDRDSIFSKERSKRMLVSVKSRLTTTLKIFRISLTEETQMRYLSQWKPLRIQSLSSIMNSSC